MALAGLLSRLLALSVLALLLLAALTLLAGLHLLHAERLVHHLLLAAHDLAKLVHLLAHLGILLAILARLHAASLQVVHHLLQLREQVARLIAVAGLRQVLDLVEHALQIALAKLLAVLGHLLGHVRVLHRALGEFAQELVHGLAQFRHQLVDLLVGGVVLQRLLQRLLRLAQPLLRSGQVAVLDRQRHLPHVVGNRAQLLVASGHRKLGAAGHDAEIVGRVLERVFGPQRDGVDQVEHVLLVGWRRSRRSCGARRPPWRADW